LLLVKAYWLSTGKCIHTLKKIIRQKRMFPHHKCMFEFVSFMYGYRCMRMHDVRFFIKTFELCLSKMVFCIVNEKSRIDFYNPHSYVISFG